MPLRTPGDRPGLCESSPQNPRIPQRPPSQGSIKDLPGDAQGAPEEFFQPLPGTTGLHPEPQGTAQDPPWDPRPPVDPKSNPKRPQTPRSLLSYCKWHTKTSTSPVHQFEGSLPGGGLIPPQDQSPPLQTSSYTCKQPYHSGVNSPATYASCQRHNQKEKE